MNDLNFSNASFVLYQILPKQRKIDFLYDAFFGDNMDEISTRYFKAHMSGVIKPRPSTSLSIMAFLTADGSRVNIIMDSDTIHINSDKLKPITDLVHTAFMDGNILFRDVSALKTPENKDQFHLKYYRSYKKINPIPFIYPIVLS